MNCFKISFNGFLAIHSEIPGILLCTDSFGNLRRNSLRNFRRNFEESPDEFLEYFPKEFLIPEGRTPWGIPGSAGLLRGETSRGVTGRISKGIFGKTSVTISMRICHSVSRKETFSSWFYGYSRYSCSDIMLLLPGVSTLDPSSNGTFATSGGNLRYFCSRLKRVVHTIS